MIIKFAVASMLMAGAMIMGSAGESEARSTRTVTCQNGKTVQAPDSQSNQQACLRAARSANASDPESGRTLSSGGAQTAQKAGNPCGPGKPAKGCRDYINGNKKPPIQPKR